MRRAPQWLVDRLFLILAWLWYLPAILIDIVRRSNRTEG